MTAATYARQKHARSQWEANSAPSQSYNCGPASVTFLADFRYDSRYLIQTTRHLATWENYRGTTYEEQRRMLVERGWNATIRNVETITDLKALTLGGRRPFILPHIAGLVPASVRGHSFTGWHSSVAAAGDAGGLLVMEPNRPENDPAQWRWWPDWVLNSLWALQPSHSVIIPYDPKPFPAAPAPEPAKRYARMKAVVPGGVLNLRESPGGTPLFKVRYGPVGLGIYGPNSQGDWVTWWAGITSRFELMGSVSPEVVRLKGFGRYLYTLRASIIVL